MKKTFFECVIFQAYFTRIFGVEKFPRIKGFRKKSVIVCTGSFCVSRTLMFAQVFCSVCTRLFSVCARDVLAVVETAPGVYICIKKNATLRRRLSHI